MKMRLMLFYSGTYMHRGDTVNTPEGEGTVTFFRAPRREGQIGPITVNVKGVLYQYRPEQLGAMWVPEDEYL